MITTITIRENDMTTSWEYAPKDSEHAQHVCDVARSLGHDVTLTTRSGEYRDTRVSIDRPWRVDDFMVA